MHRPSRRSRLGIVASLVTLVAATVLTTAPAVVASGPKTGVAHPSALTRLPDIQARSRGSINVKDLVGTARNGPGPSEASIPGPPQGIQGGSASGPSVVTPEIAATPPVPVTPTTEPPATGPSWPGFTFADALAEPPDPWVGVGPDHVVQTVNTVIQMFDREGNVDRAASRHQLRDVLRPPASLRQLRPAVHLRQPPRPVGRYGGQLGLRLQQ